ENLEISGGYYYGIKFESNWDWNDQVPFSQRSGVKNIVLRNLKIHDTGRDAIKITPACSTLTIENCEIYNTGIGPANQGNPNAEGIDAVNAHGLIVRNNYIHHTSTSGMYFKGGSSHILAEGNLVKNAGDMGIGLGFYTD